MGRVAVISLALLQPLRNHNGNEAIVVVLMHPVEQGDKLFLVVHNVSCFLTAKIGKINDITKFIFIFLIRDIEGGSPSPILY